MEFQFQMQQKEVFPPKTKHTTHEKERTTKTNKSSKFVGVRQRPSGKWVAEIKNTTQNIRMWLGTFDTAEAAARAYDEAACLLRGSNTRTNFGESIPSNSAISLKIKNLLNKKKGLKQNSTTISHSTKTSTNCLIQDVQVFDDAYKPDLTNCNARFEMGSSCFDHLLGFQSEFGGDVISQQEGLVLEEHKMTHFEDIKLESQTSAPLYEINGMSEYWDNNVNYCHDAFGDLSLLSQMFYLS